MVSSFFYVLSVYVNVNRSFTKQRMILPPSLCPFNEFNRHRVKGMLIMTPPIRAGHAPPESSLISKLEFSTLEGRHWTLHTKTFSVLELAFSQLNSNGLKAQKQMSVCLMPVFLSFTEGAESSQKRQFVSTVTDTPALCCCCSSIRLQPRQRRRPCVVGSNDLDSDGESFLEAAAFSWGPLSGRII